MSLTVDYPTYSNAREHLKDVLDATARGRTVTVARDGELSVVVPVDRLRDYLYRTVAPRIRVVSAHDRVVALMEDRPFVSEGIDIDSALQDMTVSLREYAETGKSVSRMPPITPTRGRSCSSTKLSTDEQLLAWFVRGGE